MQRPGSVTAFGILNIAFAIIGVFGTVGTVALFTMVQASNNPVLKIMRASPGYAAYLKLTIPLGLLTCGILLASGIGLLRMQPWGWKLSIGYAIYAIAFGILGSVINFFVLFRPMFEEAAQKQGPEAAGAIGGAVGGMAGACFGLVYPIVLLVFMMRPNVVAVFRPPDAPPPLPLS